MAIFAYTGFEATVKLSEETIEPKKNIPRAIILSLIVSAIVYVLASGAATSIFGWEALSTSKSPLADAVEMTGGKYAHQYVFWTGILSMSNALLMSMVTSSRMFYGVSKKGVLPSLFSYVWPKTQTPVWSVIAIGIGAIILSLFKDLEWTAKLTSVSVFITFALVNLSLIVIRMKSPKKTTSKYRLSDRFPISAVLGLVTSVVMLYYSWQNGEVVGGH